MGDGHALEMSDGDWTELLPTLKDSNGHHFDSWCNNVSRKVTCDFRNGRRPDKTIRLSDLLQTSTGMRCSSSDAMTDDAKEIVNTWINSTFYYEADVYAETEKGFAIHVHEDLVAKKDVMPDGVLQALGAIEMSKLRSQKRRLISHEPQVVENLRTCFQDTLPQCIIKEKPTGQARIRLSREEVRDEQGMLAGHKEVRFGDKSVGDKQIRNPAWIIQNARYANVLLDLTPEGTARTLGGILDNVQEILAENPTWNREMILELLQEGATPKLYSVQGVAQNLSEGNNFREATCTFQHPSGYLVPNVKIPVSLMLSVNIYKEQVQPHLN